MVGRWPWSKRGSMISQIPPQSGSWSSAPYRPLGNGAPVPGFSPSVTGEAIVGATWPMAGTASPASATAAAAASMAPLKFIDGVPPCPAQILAAPAPPVYKPHLAAGWTKALGISVRYPATGPDKEKA